MEDEFNGGRRRSIKGQGQERAAVCLVARMICRENAKEKQLGEEEKTRHQVLHGSCLITHTRGSMHLVLYHLFSGPKEWKAKFLKKQEKNCKRI
jgi:hypothetical protein